MHSGALWPSVPVHFHSSSIERRGMGEMAIVRRGRRRRITVTVQLQIEIIRYCVEREWYAVSITETLISFWKNCETRKNLITIYNF